MLAPLGEGASAEVFQALDLRDDLTVAIKLFPRSVVREEEFRREAAIAMRNVHSNLVRLVDAGVQDGRPWLALEYVDGMNARALLYRERRTVEQVLDLVRQVFAGLDAMHRAGLVHGDIKPENVIIQDRHVRVVDFGRTRLGHVLPSGRIHAGTPPYMHPGLFIGRAPTAGSDCFATWVMAYELLSGSRPWTREVLQSAGTGRLNAGPPLPNAEVDALVQAGLSGRLADARTSWLAISRFLGGRRDLPRPRPTPPPVRPDQVQEVLGRVKRHQSCAVLGHPDVTRPLLEQVDRAWRRGGGTAIWVTPGWRRDLPMADALSIAADVAESLDGRCLAEIAHQLGPLASTLAAAVPATRAWLPDVTAQTGRPEPERLALALRRVVSACPPPVLLLTQAFDRVDGASRRLLRQLLTSGVASLCVATPPDADHGLASSVHTPPLPDEPDRDVEAHLGREARAVLQAARVLDLPLGRTLARACGLSTQALQTLAWDLEAVGTARWTGEEIVPRPGPLPGPQAQRSIFRAAANGLDAAREPQLVARCAMHGEDAERLMEVIGPAVEAAARRAPEEALELLAADPRPPTAPRLLERFRIALLARDMAAAEQVLARLRSFDDVSAADLAEAEGELAFRRGDTETAIAAFERAATALGSTVPGGITGSLHDGRAIWQISRCVLPTPNPDRRLARVLEALYDLRFSHDNAYLLRLHRLWLAAAPDDTRALAIEVLWRQLLGKADKAEQLDRELSQRVREDRDPVGAAVLQLHRAMARLLRGETAAAFSDGVDAATRLLRAGDPYYAALAATLPTACAVHVAGADTLAEVHRNLLLLVDATGDERTARWAEGIDGVVCWQRGDLQGAVTHTVAWADAAARRDDASESLARRFLAELHLETGGYAQAFEALQRADVVARALHVRMDYTDARAIALLMADSQARLDGQSGIGGRRALEKRIRGLVRRSPRWEPRAEMARAMAAAADGDLKGAADGFSAAVRAAMGRGQVVDAWLVLHHQAATLDDDQARASAATLAATHRLRQDGTP